MNKYIDIKLYFNKIFHLYCLTNKATWHNCIILASYVCCGNKNLKNFILLFKIFQIPVLILF